MIEDAGWLTLTESNVSWDPPHPHEVVWFLDRPLEPGEEDLHGLGGGFADKSEVEITVDIPDSSIHPTIVAPWLVWARCHPDFQDWWVDTMISTGGGLELARHWWITTMPIPAEWWHNISIRRPAST
jgi:hypothetical protein